MNEQLKIIISAEIDKLKKGVADAKGEINKLSGEANQNSSKLKESFNTIGEASKGAAKKVATAFAAIGTALVAAAVGTQEYRDDIAKLNTAYEAVGKSTDAAKTAYSGLYRVLGETDQAVEASQQIALLAQSEESVAKWSELAAGVVGKFGDALQPETFYEAANETLALGEATGAFTQMLEGCHMSVEEFNKGLAECKTASEKEAYMLEWTEKCLGKNAEAFRKNNAEVLAQRDAQMRLQEQLAKVGEAIAPVITAFTSFAADALAIAAPYIQDLAEKYLPQLQEALNTIKDRLAPLGEFLLNHLPLVITLAGIIVAIGAGFTIASAALTAYTTITGLWTAATTIATAAQTAFAAVNVAALAPILAVVAAIAAVVAIIVICVKHWDKIKETVVKVAQAIWEKVQEMKDKVVARFEEMKANIQEKITAIKEVVSIIFGAIVDNIKVKIETAKEIVKNVVGLIKAIFTGDFGAAKTAVLGIFDAIKSGIKTRIDNAKDAVKTAIDKIKGFFNFSWKLPKLKMPRISISGKFSLNPPSAPKFSISWNKLGGIFDKPTLFNYGGSLQGIGEDGAEAVVPLEKNTKWLDKLAERITAKQGNVPIVLQVDGKTFAQVSIDSINALTRQRGTLGLNII